MNVRLIPSAPPNSPASKTTLSRGDAWPDSAALDIVQSSWAKTKAAKSTSCESSTSRSSVERPGLNVVVQGSTSATSSSPRAIASSRLACSPDDPRKIRGFMCRLLFHGYERPDRRVGPDLRSGLQRELDAAEALRGAERRAVEGVDRVAAVEVADPTDAGIVVVRAVRVRPAHRADGDVLEDRERAELGRSGGHAGVAGGAEDRLAVVPQRERLRHAAVHVDVA